MTDSGEQPDQLTHREGDIVEHPLKGRFDVSRAEWQHAEGSAVEVAFVDDLIGMRNGEDPDGPVLIFTQDEWDAFVLGARDGEFDPETFEAELREQEAAERAAAERDRAAGPAQS